MQLFPLEKEKEIEKKKKKETEKKKRILAPALFPGAQHTTD